MQDGKGTSGLKESKRIKACREEIYDMMKPYLREDRGRGRTGPLKFLKDLFVCSVAVSSKSRKGLPAFKKFVDEHFLTVDEEVLSYFDCEKNMTAFQAWEKDLIFYSAYDESFGFPTFLLLQKARMVKDEALVRYLELEDMDEAAGDDDIDEVREKKLDAYLEWILAIAFFEICADTYYQKASAEMDRMIEAKSASVKRLQELSECIQSADKVYRTKKGEELREWERGVRDLLSVCVQDTHQLYYLSFFYLYALETEVDLFASVRLMVLIEYVNINGTVREGIDCGTIFFKNKNYRIAYEESRFWEMAIDRWLTEEKGAGFVKQFFVVMDTWNRNHVDRYKKLNGLAHQLYALNSEKETERLKEQLYFQDMLNEYISVLGKRYSGGRFRSMSREQKQKELEEMALEEKRLSSIKLWLGIPVWRELRKRLKEDEEETH